MKTWGTFNGLSKHTGILALIGIFVLSGCATIDYVEKQVNLLVNRLAQTENQIDQLSGRMTINENKLSDLEVDLGKVDEELETLGSLKLEHRLLIEMKEGANFGFNSATLSDKAIQKIDEFLVNLQGDLADGQTAVFLVAGHTDNAGSDDFNYELGKRRADAVSRYLITQKEIDPLRVVKVSYGENFPITGNNTHDDRARNRRVEILVYREAINSNIAAMTP